MNNTINKHAEILKSCEPKCNKSVFWTHKQCFPLFLLTHIKKKKCSCLHTFLTLTGKNHRARHVFYNIHNFGFGNNVGENKIKLERFKI